MLACFRRSRQNGIVDPIIAVVVIIAELSHRLKYQVHIIYTIM